MTKSKENLILIEKLTFALGLTTTYVVHYFQSGGKGAEKKSPEEIIEKLNKNRKE